MMTGKDDADSIREDSFLDDLYPQFTEYLAEQYADGYDADARRARFLTWLVRHTEEPSAPAPAPARRPHRTLPEASPGLSTSAGASPAPSAMRKMAVYLGLVEDDHQYADAYHQYAYDQYAYEEYADEEYAYDGRTDTPGEAGEDEVPTGQRSERTPETTGLTRVTTMHPRSYNDANVELTAEDKARIAERGFFNQG